jgi:hypothetical protein
VPRIQAVPLVSVPSEPPVSGEASAPLRSALARLGVALRHRHRGPAAAPADDPHAPIRTLVDPRDIYLA